jgi:hypothetical protein
VFLPRKSWRKADAIVSCPVERLVRDRECRQHRAVPDDGLSPDDVRAIILTLMRIEEKLNELLGEDDDDGEEEDLA